MRFGGWALAERTDIPDVADPSQVYIRRWRLVETPWAGVFVHQIRLPDDTRGAVHDHPWPFVSLVLAGGYEEELVTDADAVVTTERTVERRAGSVHAMGTRSAHLIRRLLRIPTWTLVLVGPRRRRWGYWTAEGWVDHEDHHHRLNPTAFAARPT